MRTTMHAAFIIVTLCVVVGSTSRVAAFVPSPFINIKQLHRNRVGPRAAATVDSSEKSADDSSNGATKKAVKFVNHVIPDDAPSHRLKEAFNTSMRNPAVPLLSSWDSYEASMPVRRSSKAQGYYRLVNVPFYATNDSMRNLVSQLEYEFVNQQANDPRFAVAYLSAKRKSGKTASIMSAFLNSYESNRGRRFSHYLYMSFQNNANKNFSSDAFVNDNTEIAKRQGAVFMYRCMEWLFRCKYGEVKTKDVADNILGSKQVIIDAPVGPSAQLPEMDNQENEDDDAFLDRVTERINQLLNNKIPGEHQHILIHLDEHRKMNDNPNFRRGAMIALAKCDRVKCVATFTEPLTELLADDKSSGVSRQPCTHITFDLRAYLDQRYSVDIRRLVAWQDLELTSIQKRKWATLAFRMAANVQSCLPGTLLLAYANGTTVQPSPSMQRVQNELERFGNVTDGMATLDDDNGGITALNNALGQCSVAAKLDAFGVPEHDDFALVLMNGISEVTFKMELFGNTSVACGLSILNGKVVASWQDLLTLKYDPIQAFETALNRFTRRLSSNDYLSGSPLEEAYCWSLLSRSAPGGLLNFGDDAFSFDFKANKCKTGRLFRTDNATELHQIVNPMKLKNGVLYRAAEGGNGVDFLQELPTVNDVQVDDQGVTAAPTATALQTDQPQVTHPLCDLFFKSDDDELVMIDITGGNDLTEEKAKKLDEWIGKYGGELKKGTGLLRIVGIVLAPFDKVATVTETSGEASATQPGIELPAGDLSDEEETRDVSAIEEGDSEQPSANEGGAEKSVEEAQGDRNDGSGSATIYRKGGGEQVLMVTGSNAIDMLGALGQFAEWFDTDSLGESEIPAAEPPATIDEEGQAAQPADQSGASSEAGLE